MIRLLVVSNLRCKELSEFLERRGTFEVAACLQSLALGLADIQNRIIDVDKMLYLYQLDSDDDSSINIRSDMEMLSSLLRNGSFFSPGEIVFMIQNSTKPEYLQAERYFMSVMETTGYSDYSVKKIDGTISFSAVYDSMMGITVNASFKNSYNVLWRAERNSDSDIAYEAQDDHDLLLEPFTFENVERYFNQKSIVAKTGSSVEFKDGYNYEKNKFSDPDFGKFRVDSILAGPSINIISGKSKSGLSIWACALAASAKFAGKNVFIIDYTSNSDISETFRQFGIQHDNVSMKEFLSGKENSGSLISVCAPHNDREDTVKVNFLQRTLRMFSNKSYNVVIVAVCIEMFPQVISLTNRKMDNTFLTVIPRHSDVVELQRYANILENCRVSVILNKSLAFDNDNYISPAEVKNILALYNPRIVGSVVFENLNIKDNLFNGLIVKEDGDGE